MLQLAGKGIATRKNRTDRSAPLFQVHNEKEARRLLEGGGLAAAGLSARELDSLPGSDVRKVALANLLLERTVARQSWIADKLAMCSAVNVSQQVRRYRTRRPRLATTFRECLESASLSRFVDWPLCSYPKVDKLRGLLFHASLLERCFIGNQLWLSCWR